MAEEATVETEATEAVVETVGGVEIESRPKKGMSGKKLVMLVILPVLLLGGGGAAAYFGGFLDPLLRVEKPVVADGELELVVEQSSDIFYELPEMLVNLSGNSRRARYLKLVVSLELSDDENIKELEEAMPRIVDNFQVYLRELRVEDLHGTAGMQRLREELLLRVNASTKLGQVRDVLFKEMLVQ